MEDRSPMWVAVLLSVAAGLFVLLLGGVILVLVVLSNVQPCTSTSSRVSLGVLVGLAIWVVLAFLVPFVSALEHRRVGVFVGFVTTVLPGLLLGSAVLSLMRPEQFVRQWCF